MITLLCWCGESSSSFINCRALTYFFLLAIEDQRMPSVELCCDDSQRQRSVESCMASLWARCVGILPVLEE